MLKYAIDYIDSDGELSQRVISDIHTEGKDFIDAYCHLRNDRRLFKMKNILLMSNAETGEIVSDIWREFGLDISADGRRSIDSILFACIGAIKALKFFSLTTRGFAKRERGWIVEFVKDQPGMEAYSESEIEDWLQSLWCGDVHEYRSGNFQEYKLILNAIPTNMMPKCKEVAVKIAAGSKRREIDPELYDRINSDFCA